jgi:transcriptional regulator with XRE-family HTH domain
MGGRKMKFGAFVRREREGRDIGLREMAKMIAVSPTYLSKIERDEFPPPAEDKVKAIAKIIQFDSDELLARAGRVSSDITTMLIYNPQLSSALRNLFNAVPTATTVSLNFKFPESEWPTALNAPISTTTAGLKPQYIQLHFPGPSSSNTPRGDQSHRATHKHP